MPTQTSERRDTSRDKKSPLPWILIALAVLAVLLLLAFGLGWIDFASSDGNVDVELPETNVDTDLPDADIDVDVDGELEGDADAEVPSS